MLIFILAIELEVTRIQEPIIFVPQTSLPSTIALLSNMLCTGERTLPFAKI